MCDFDENEKLQRNIVGAIPRPAARSERLESRKLWLCCKLGSLPSKSCVCARSAALAPRAAPPSRRTERAFVVSFVRSRDSGRGWKARWK